MWPFKKQQPEVVPTDNSERIRKLNYRKDIVSRYLQKLTVQNLYIKYLQKACDHWEWEHDKKTAIIELRDKEIKELKDAVGKMQHERDRARHEFKEYLQKAKKAKDNNEKVENQRLKIIELTRELEETQKRLKVRDGMLRLMEKQQKKT